MKRRNTSGRSTPGYTTERDRRTKRLRFRHLAVGRSLQFRSSRPDVFHSTVLCVHCRSFIRTRGFRFGYTRGASQLALVFWWESSQGDEALGVRYVRQEVQNDNGHHGGRQVCSLRPVLGLFANQLGYGPIARLLCSCAREPGPRQGATGCGIPPSLGGPPGKRSKSMG